MVRQAHHERIVPFVRSWSDKPVLNMPKGSPRWFDKLTTRWFDKPVLSMPKGSPRWFDKLTTNGFCRWPVQGSANPAWACHDPFMVR